MAVPYESTGRTRQKARTRTAIVEAARELFAEGTTPTVEMAAERAGVSRTTAYRYFPNWQTLLVASYPEVESASLLGDEAPDDPEKRLELVTERLAEQILASEPQLRATLRMSLEVPAPTPEELPLRRGRAIGWIEDALAPLQARMDRDEIRRLALAIRATLGIEALAWLTDVAGLSRKDAVDLMRSSARTLLGVALAELNGHGGGAGRPEGAGRRA